MVVIIRYSSVRAVPSPASAVTVKVMTRTVTLPGSGLVSGGCPVLRRFQFFRYRFPFSEPV
jgi:hypothetical protein